ncbi:MAG: stage II sporulation protein D [Oscillospiraceae bacterium]|jgi:stage II sporulation protein D|nr:stage II sporulation protein D [Oscillospiraceae bacterium]
MPRFAGDKPVERSIETISVYDTKAQALVDMPLETYVQRAVAAEMPASYDAQALKAQAVAARTRAIAGRCVRYSKANVCTDSGCCQAYIDQNEQQNKWGESYSLYYNKINNAVIETSGEILTFDGEPILVLYHAVSGGRTEDVELVFAQALPYLRGVESKGEEGASRYESRQTFTRQAFADGVNAAYPQARLRAESLEEQIEILERSESDRVLTIRLGDTQVDGRALRSTLNLYSTNFIIAFTPDTVDIKERGYGHGVGMSQAGAQAMAEEGASYREILSYYYTGVTIVSWSSGGK